MAEEIKIVASAVGFDQVNKALDSTAKSLTQTSQAATQAGKALGNELKVATGSASSAVTNLSRIVSDSAYGFIGIANNIQPFIDSLGYAKKEAQATGTSMKDNLIAALTGAGGLSLAFAAVTTAITFAQIGFSAWTRGSSQAKSSIDSMDESTRNLSIDIKNLGEDLKLVKVQFDLIKEYKTLEFDIKFGKGYTSDLKMAELDVTQLGYAQDFARNEFAKSRKAWDEANAALYGFTQTQQGSFDSTNKFADAVAKLGDLTNISSANLSGFTDEQKVYIQNVIDAGKKVSDLRDKYYSYNDQIALAKLRVEALKDAERRRLEELRKNQPAFERDLKFKPIKVLPIEVSNKKIQEQIQKDLSKITIQKVVEIPITFMPAKTGLIEITDAINSFMSDAAMGIGMAFADILSQAITGGITFGDAFKGVFNALGGAIAGLGKELIKIGTLAIAAKLALDTVLANPYAVVAIGIALAALGSAIQKTTSKQRFATGTRYAPGGMALVGERGPEMINLPRGSQVIPAAQTSQMMGGIGGAIEVFGMLRGQDIYFSNKKYGQTYKRTT
jgi:hypothetical protein